MVKIATAVPQDCPRCGAAALVKNPRPKYWFFACSKNSPLLGAHRVEGHPMHTKSAALAEWNKLT